MILPRALRRIAVVSMYGAYLAGTVLQFAMHETVSYPERWVILGLFAFAFLAGLLLLAATHYLPWSAAREERLDERERATRNAVYHGAYRIVAWGSLIPMLLWWLTQSWQPRPFGVDANVIFWGYVLVLATLPAALLAWHDRPA